MAAEWRVGDFNAQELANTAWAFAKAGQPDAQLFMALARAAERRVGDFNAKHLANTAWAFAVANCYSDQLFGPAFAHCCETTICTYAEVQHLARLHQWVLWHQELELPRPLSPALRDRCFAAFCATPSSPSQMQRKVTAALAELGAHLKEEWVIEEGYSIDVLVLNLWEGEQVAVEVDGSSHFLRGNVGHSPNGATLLKHRQLRALGWRLVSVPYWEWDEVKGSKATKREYLLRKLKQVKTMAGSGKDKGKKEDERTSQEEEVQAQALWKK